MSHSSPTVMAQGRGAMRKINGPVGGVQCGCFKSADKAKTWHAAKRYRVLSQWNADGLARAQTAPTLKAKTITNERHCHCFSSSPTSLGLTLAAGEASVRSDLSATNAWEDMPAAPQIHSVTLSAVSPHEKTHCLSPKSVARLMREAVRVLPVDNTTVVVSPSGLNSNNNKGRNNSRAVLSRKGLSVHATPFQPRGVSSMDILSMFESSEFGDVLHLQGAQQPEVTSSMSLAVGGGSGSGSGSGFPAVGWEFPCSPLVGESSGLRVPISAGNNAGARVAHASSAGSLCGGESIQLSSLPLSPALSVQQQQQQQQRHNAFHGTVNVSRTLYDVSVCQTDFKEEHAADDVCHRRIPVTDEEAKDEDGVIHKLLDNGGDYSDTEDEEYILLEKEQTHVLPKELFHYEEAYWDLEGPSVETRRFLHRGTSSIASLTLATRNNRGSPDRNLENSVLRACASVGGFNDDDELWEMNSSAYADSLDEAQVEWIEQQLQAKENPDDFFF